MRKLILQAVILLALVTVGCRPAYGESSPVVIRVALSVAFPFEFLLEQDAHVFPLPSVKPLEDGKDAAPGLEGAANEPYISLSASKEPFRIRAGDVPGEVVLCYPSGGTISFPEGLCIVPADPRSAAFQIGRRRYPGGLEVSYRVSKGGSREPVAINLVDLETYTEGVLAGEVYPTWAPEALKAQAVATRTYALRRRSENKSGNYDVDDTVLSQVYSGENKVEAFRTAVFETRGQILVYEGIPIRAHYFSSGGGITEGDEEVWLGGNDEPYLTARQDFDWISPHYRWTEPLAIESRDLFGKLGLTSDYPGWIEPSARSGDKILAYRIYAGGRTVNLTREQIRHKLGLESPRFHITVRDCEGQEIIVESRIELCSSAVLLFDGVGKGHGVGLSQWGAQSMALMCTSDGTPIYNYVDILKHYYPGTELVDNYGIPREHIEIASDVGVEPFYEGCEGSAEHVQPMEDDHVEPGCDDRAEPVQEDRDCARPVSHDYTERTYEEDQKQIEPAHGDHIEFLPE